MAAGTGRRRRLNRIDRTLRIGHRVQPGQRQSGLLRTVDVTEGAFRYVRGRAGGAQAGEQDA